MRELQEIVYDFYPNDADNLRLLADFIDMEHRQGKWDGCDFEVQGELRRMAKTIDELRSKQ
jgi:hypothetical protein